MTGQDDPTPHSTQPVQPPKPALVYGSTEGDDLIFAPLDEVQRYAGLRTGGGFPMTWGELRAQFGQDAYDLAVEPFVQNAVYASFEEFFNGEYLSEAYWDGTLQEPCDWSDWYDDYCRRLGPDEWFKNIGKHRSLQPGRPYSNVVAYWEGVKPAPDLAAVELADWFEWYCRNIPEGVVKPATIDAFRQEIEVGIAQNQADLETLCGEAARHEYHALPIGDEGRVPEDGDQAAFMDSEGNESNSPIYINYWPAQRMLAWFPRDLVHRYGRVVDSVHDGEFVTLSSGRTNEIVAASRLSDTSAFATTACSTLPAVTVTERVRSVRRRADRWVARKETPPH